MKSKVIISILVLLALLHFDASAQFRVISFKKLETERISSKSFVASGSFFLTGGLLVMTHSPLHPINTRTSRNLQELFPGFRIKTDDWLQYVPGGGSLALGMIGIPGEHKLGGKFIRYAISSTIATATVQGLKKWTHVLRPDGTTFNSFPSGHTATAFTGAEILHQEYGKKSVWYSVFGYSLASATGLMRMLNNRHSLGDVLGGAGIGIASVRFSYWLADKMYQKRKVAAPITF